VVIINEGRIVVEDMLSNLTHSMTLEQVFLHYITEDSGNGRGATEGSGR